MKQVKVIMYFEVEESGMEEINKLEHHADYLLNLDEYPEIKSVYGVEVEEAEEKETETEMKQEHYVVLEEWGTEGSGVSILGVTHSMEEAKQIFNANINEEREFAKNNEYTIYEDSEVIFNAGENGLDNTNQVSLYIQRV
jgi:hypothetical protein